MMRYLLGPSGFCYPLRIPRHRVPELLCATATLGTTSTRMTAVCKTCSRAGCRSGTSPRSSAGWRFCPGANEPTALSSKPIDRLPDQWLTAEYEPGDVLVFHGLTTHAASPKRLSACASRRDHRWLLADQPAHRRLVIGPTGAEIGSRFHSRQPWWRPVSAGLQLFDEDLDGPRSKLPAPPSRFVPFFSTAGRGHWRTPDPDIGVRPGDRVSRCRCTTTTWTSTLRWTSSGSCSGARIPHTESGDVTIDILYPGDAKGEGLVRHCTFRVPHYLLTGGKGQSWEAADRGEAQGVVEVQRRRTSAVVRGGGHTRLEDLGNGPTRVHFSETYHAFNPLLRALLEKRVPTCSSPRTTTGSSTELLETGVKYLRKAKAKTAANGPRPDTEEGAGTGPAPV